MVNVFLERYDANSKCDIYQGFFTSAINVYCCAWTFLVFVIVGKKWKNAIMYIIIMHYALRYIGNVIENIGKLRTVKYEKYDYPSNEGYMWNHAVSRVVLYISEIIGDWYLLVRTKAIVKSNKKLKWVYVTCIIYNIVRLSKIYFNFKYVPFKDNFDPKEDKLDFYLRKVEYKKNKWICDLLLHTTSIFYDLAVIITLKKNVFVKYNNITHGEKKGNFFIANFQRLSVYRIYWTVILSILFSPLIFMFCFTLLYALNQVNTLKPEQQIAFFQTYCNDRDIENIRISIMNVSYILIYVDQIMLRHYDRINKVTVINQSSNSYNNSSSINQYSNNNGSRLHNFSKVYHDTNKQFDDTEGQNLICYKNNDENIYNKSFNLNNSEMDNINSPRTPTSLNSFNSPNPTNSQNSLNIPNYKNSSKSLNFPNQVIRNNKDPINYYDFTNKNDINNMSINCYNNNKNNQQWKKYFNSLNQNNY